MIFNGLIKRNDHAAFSFAAISFYDSTDLVTDGNLLARGSDDALRAAKKCPSRITTFNGRSVHGCGFSVSFGYIGVGGRFIAPRKMIRSLVSRCERAYRNLRVDKDNPGSYRYRAPMKLTHSSITPAYAWHAWEKADATRRRGTDHA